MHRTQADWQALVQAAAESVGILNSERALGAIDSLNVIDLVIELERLSGLEIPGESMRAGTFQSVEHVATMLAQLSGE